MFIVALFTIAGTWKQPRCPSAEEWIKRMWYIYTMEYYSAKKEQSCGIFRDVDGPRDCHPERDKLIYNITYTWNIEKKVYMNLLAKDK